VEQIGPPVAVVLGSGSIELPALGSLQFADVCLEVSVPAGEHCVTAEADHLHQVTEADEHNNRVGEPFRWR
jgi:hypothetical protein